MSDQKPDIIRGIRYFSQTHQPPPSGAYDAAREAELERLVAKVAPPRRQMPYGKIAIFFLTAFIAWFGTRAYHGIRYDQDIGGHLKLAADANTTELAQERLKIAIDGMNAWNLCNSMGDECFTSVLWRTPDEDIGYWRTNIQSTYEDLSSMTEAERADNLIESNQLMKVRETLLDSGENGVDVTDPDGISIYPHNALYMLWGWVSFLGLLGIGVTWFVREEL